MRSCPRCQGDMYRDRDVYGTFHTCLQCSYTIDYIREDAPQFPKAKEKRYGRQTQKID